LDGGEPHEGFKGCGEVLEVLGEAAISPEPGEGALDYRAAGENLAELARRGGCRRLPSVARIARAVAQEVDRRLRQGHGEPGRGSAQF
jgi:hypothetical protein